MQLLNLKVSLAFAPGALVLALSFSSCLLPSYSAPAFGPDFGHNSGRPLLAQNPVVSSTPVAEPEHEPKAETEIDPAKKAAIRELLQVTKMGENVNAMRDLMLTQVRRTIDTVVKNQIATDTHLSDDRKKEMLNHLSESSDRIINRYKQLSDERINMPLLMEQVAYKVYDESFTTGEIQDIITFYRTPTGQKALRELPQIMQRSMIMTSQALQSKVVDIIKEVTSEEFARLKSSGQCDEKQPDKPVDTKSAQ